MDPQSCGGGGPGGRRCRGRCKHAACVRRPRCVPRRGPEGTIPGGARSSYDWLQGATRGRRTHLAAMAGGETDRGLSRSQAAAAHTPRAAAGGAAGTRGRSDPGASATLTPSGGNGKEASLHSIRRPAASLVQEGIAACRGVRDYRWSADWWDTPAVDPPARSAVLKPQRSVRYLAPADRTRAPRPKPGHSPWSGRPNDPACRTTLFSATKWHRNKAQNAGWPGGRTPLRSS